MLLLILGIVDVIGGILLGMSLLPGAGGNPILFWFGVVFLLKGLYSLLTAMGSGFYFDILGMMDIVSGIFLFLATWSIINEIFLYLGIGMIIKGIYSMLMGWSAG